MHYETELENALAGIAARLEEDRKSLSMIESRIALIHEEVRRTAETVTRLKLMSDNARRLAISHSEAIERLSERFGADAPR